MNFIQIFGAVELGMIYALVAIGVYLSFRVLDFPDLTADGSFPMGAAIAATFIIQGYNPWLATGLAFLGGCLAGYVTAYISVKFKILSLLASILTMTALYSINLRIMSGRPHISLMSEATILSGLESYFTGLLTSTTVLGAVMVIFMVGLLYWLLSSNFGLGLRATGANPIMAKAQGVNTKAMTLFGIALSNGIIALGGALFAQSQAMANINMGQSTIVIGLASVIIGEVFLPPRYVIFSLLGCIIGSVFYRLAVTGALNADFLGLQASDLNLMTAVIVALAMILPHLKQKTAARLRRG